MTKAIDINGQSFGRLTVVERAHNNKTGQARWVCLCDCGTYCTVLSICLRSESTKSCGCLNSELTANRNKTHGKSGTPEYISWKSMNCRCNNKKVKAYVNYGGRGIKICKRWERFENFLKDMGSRPKGLTLDRKNNNGNYEPSNCHWATRKEQAQNRRSSRKYQISPPFESG